MDLHADVKVNSEVEMGGGLARLGPTRPRIWLRSPGLFSKSIGQKMVKLYSFVLIVTFLAMSINFLKV